MKKHESLSLVLLLAVPLGACRSKQADQVRTGPPPREAAYLGQKPPGLTPEVFAPGIVTTEYMEFFGSFTPDLREFYFKRKGGKYDVSTLVVLRYEDDRWSESVVSPPEASIGEPSISPDGNTLYLGSRYIERTPSGWSTVRSLGAPFEDTPIMRLTASAEGTYVFDEREEVGTLRYSRRIDGRREAPRAFGDEINAGRWTAHPFIAPDESYLIWDSEREGGYGDSDLYVSFRQKDGSWGPAVNMGGEINDERENIYGTVTPDGRYLFFHTYLEKGKSNIYWVDAQILEELRAQSPSTAL